MTGVGGAKFCAGCKMTACDAGFPVGFGGVVFFVVSDDDDDDADGDDDDARDTYGSRGFRVLGSMRSGGLLIRGRRWETLRGFLRIGGDVDGADDGEDGELEALKNFAELELLLFRRDISKPWHVSRVAASSIGTPRRMT